MMDVICTVSLLKPRGVMSCVGACPSTLTLKTSEPFSHWSCDGAGNCSCLLLPATVVPDLYLA
jgi:hypothetical protein